MPGRKPSITAAQEDLIINYYSRGMSLNDIKDRLAIAGEQTVKGKPISRDVINRVLRKQRGLTTKRTKKTPSSLPLVTEAITPQLTNCGDSLTPIPVGARRALLETQQERATLWGRVNPAIQQAFSQLNQEYSDGNLETALNALKTGLSLLDSVDRSEDGWQRLIFYQDNRGTCPDPSAHDRQDSGALGPVVVKLRQALIDDANYTEDDFKRLLG